ncbi:MAG TPA: long-chain fatty acid--CoA ligase [Actinomycetota bacterium]|nr:long-chain fatty acid--CoA ligase [Actinomycetota bacterium]
MAVTGRTLTEIFENRVARSADRVAMRVKADDGWRAITFREYDDQARAIANGLISLGVQKGDTVALLSTNRPEWHVADLGILLAGAVTVPVYVTNSSSQVAHVAGHSDARVIFVENQYQLDKVTAALKELPSLRKIVVMSGEGGSSDLLMSFDQLRQRGRDFVKTDPAALKERTAGITPDDTATIVYTSGTTGLPKGSVLSHGGFAWTLECLGQVLHFGDCEERVISYLPLSHVFERLASEWGGIFFCFEVWFCESTDKLRENLKDCRPTFFIGVPRVFEKFASAIQARYAEHEKADTIAKALAAAMERVELQQAGKPIPLPLKVKNALFDKVIFAKTREELGMDACRFAVTGSAPVAPEVIKFIHAIGIDLVEAYGQTETNAPTTVTPAGKARIGTVGPPIPGLEMKFDEDGEILVKGPNLFKGYLNDPEATAEALTEDGFLRTGDVGALDEAGYLKITDRKKDIIITAGGKNIAPQEIEGRLTVSPMVSQAVVIGDLRPYLTALLTLDFDAAGKWADALGVQPSDPRKLSREPKVLQEIGALVEKVNEGLSQVEKIKKWTLLENDFTQEAEEITPTFKVKRKTISTKYAPQIEAMYVK